MGDLLQFKRKEDIPEYVLSSVVQGQFTVYYLNRELLTITSNHWREHFISVIREIRLKTGLNLAPAKKVWDDYITFQNLHNNSAS